MWQEIQRLNVNYLILAITFCLPGMLNAEETLAPEHVDGARTIDTDTARSLHDQGVVFVDVRKQEDYDAGHIPDARHLSIRSDFTEQNLAAIAAKDSPLVVYCNGIRCMGSSKAAQKAVAWGWTVVHYYRDGMPEWVSGGYPVN